MKNTGQKVKARKSRGRNFTPDERAIMLRVITQDGTLDDVNAQLTKHQESEGLSNRLMPIASYMMMKNSYVQHLQDDDAVKAHVFHPATLRELKSRAMVSNNENVQ